MVSFDMTIHIKHTIDVQLKLELNGKSSYKIESGSDGKIQTMKFSFNAELRFMQY